MKILKFLVLLLAFVTATCDDRNKNPNMVDGRKAIVHLFEWRWDDIADECENHLGPKGFGAVQVSPVTENAILENRPWYERYQTVSYLLETRSGDEKQFQNMVMRCNNASVRIYVDVILNHMTGGIGKGNGTGGSFFDPDNLDYPGVPYNSSDFNTCETCNTLSCNIEDFANPHQVQYCRLVGLKDLDQSKPSVREKIINFLNHLIGLGVAGFRVDAAKHIPTDQLKMIYDRLQDLNTDWFPNGTKPFIYQEVVDFGGEGIGGRDYTPLGRITEFKYGAYLGRVLRRQDGLKYLNNFGTGWGLTNSENALAFIDNHDNQRNEGSSVMVTHKLPKLYNMAVAFMFAWPYGVPRVMSSFEFETESQGPPNENEIISHAVTSNSCNEGWVCEHRWRPITNMVKFGIVVGDTGVNDWWSGHTHQIAFSRGDLGFIAINNEDFHLKTTIQTGLPPGVYCDVISGEKIDNKCTGYKFTVKNDRKIDLDIGNDWTVPMIALHLESKLCTN